VRNGQELSTSRIGIIEVAAKIAPVPAFSGSILFYYAGHSHASLSAKNCGLLLKLSKVHQEESPHVQEGEVPPGFTFDY
jgi:hypothetical protein